jgi:archaetidylinositol phosphate synthase
MLRVTQPFTSWTHRLARLAVRPLVGTGITPNNLTTARVVTGVASCAAFMIGDPTWDLWGGLLWLVSCFLDRADGELARIGAMSSPNGHLYDYYSDVAINALFFVAIGIGLRDGFLGHASIAFGVIAGSTVAIASVLSERLEKFTATGDKAYAGVLGFDFDDVLYLFAPAVWIDWSMPLLIGASVGGPVFAVITWQRLNAEVRRQAIGAGTRASGPDSK